MKTNAKVYTCIGASNHCKDEREKNDFYATDPAAIDALLEHVELSYCNTVWEPACGMGHLSDRLAEKGFFVHSSDIVDRGYTGTHHDFVVNDFLNCNPPAWYANGDKKLFVGDIVTNPPYKIAAQFVERALDMVNIGNKVCMFLKLTFLEGVGRKELFDRGELQKVIVFRKRIICAKNGDFKAMKESGFSAVAYAWFVWEKGWYGQPTIEWC